MDMTTIKNFNAERENLEDLIFMAAVGSVVAAEFEKLNVEAPDWLETKLKAIRRQIRSTVEDRLEKRLTDAKLRLQSLKTPIEKKADLQKEIRQLQQQLAEV